MSWVIRRMTADDLDAVLELAAKIPEAPHWRRAEYEHCVSPDESAPLQRVGFTAEGENRVIGFSVGRLVAGVCELESIAVDQEARGRGIGRALFEALTDWACVRGANRIELEVRASNTTAIQLYQQSGLRREGIRAAYYKSPVEDAVLMGTILKKR